MNHLLHIAEIRNPQISWFNCKVQNMYINFLATTEDFSGVQPHLHETDYLENL